MAMRFRFSPTAALVRFIGAFVRWTRMSRASKSIQPARGLNTFAHDEFTIRICPQAEGHFCMLWGEHGHGGFDSFSHGYVQGGQPMDAYFELGAAYVGFKEAREKGDWSEMRSAITELRAVRANIDFSLTEEREVRKGPEIL
jgi:hypothetical protein